MPKYDLKQLKEALMFNVVEIIPGDGETLDKELHVLIENSETSGEPIQHYIGFEISGQIHIGTGIASGLKIKKLQDTGVKCMVYLANYHTWLNGKLDGKMETISQVSREYFEPVLKKSFEVVGCDLGEIEFIRGDEAYFADRNGKNFWMTEMKISRELTLSRVLKSISVTGKTAGNDVNFGTLRYAPMQVADCFFFGSHIVHAGMDQRKCHVLMREVASKLDGETGLKIAEKQIKPIAIHHALLHGLGQPESTIGEDGIEKLEVGKMSKSKPDSAIWVHETPEEIMRKLKKAYCPMPRNGEQTTEEIIDEQKLNPLLNWCKNMIFPAGKTIKIQRKPEWGGDLSFQTFEELEKAYFAGQIHPMDLKNGVANCLIEWFVPIRTYIEQNPAGLNRLKNQNK
jgi:tyrosyl-tRNA synthetase